MDIVFYEKIINAKLQCDFNEISKRLKSIFSKKKVGIVLSIIKFFLFLSTYQTN